MLAPPKERDSRMQLTRKTAKLALAITALAAVQGGAAESPEAESVQRPITPNSVRSFDAVPANSALRYDTDYPVIGYSRTPRHNAVARLQERIDRGEVRLEYREPRGYLDSLLEHLDIDPSSQTLLYSKTSLQFLAINASTPRALYFNEDTYVGWIPGTDLLELMTMDAELGPVFYGLANEPGAEQKLVRETSRCLTCHDTYGMMGGGVPRFLLLSATVDTSGALLPGGRSFELEPDTPMSERWAGWFVTGRHGSMEHLGNILIPPTREPVDLTRVRRGNIDSVDGLFDVKPYLRNTSDIVALLVFEHQVHVHNAITRFNYKARTFLAQEAANRGQAEVHWQDASPRIRTGVQRMMDQIVETMFFVGVPEFTDEIQGTSGFDRWFESRGPTDPQGRSLRQLDLRTRLLKYPLSYMVYSAEFDALPHFAKTYIYGRFAEVLSGRDQSGKFAHLSAEDRRAIFEILTATKPEFAELVGHSSAGT
jgi:hypothetical protein